MGDVKEFMARGRLATRQRGMRALAALTLFTWLLTPLGDGLSAPPAVWAAPVAQPMAAPVAQPAEQAKPPIFEDSFADNRAGWPEDELRHFDQDGYHLAIPQSNDSLLYHASPKNPPRLADISVEAQVTFVDGDDTAAYGVSLRSTVVPRRDYWLLVNALGKYAMGRTSETGSVAMVSWRRSPALNQGNAANTLRLVARGKRVSAYLNGQQVASVEDDTIPEVGAFELQASSGAHVLVQHLVVTESTDKDVAPLPPGPRPLFQDNFFDNREQWPVGDVAYVDQDGYHIALPDEDEPRVYPVIPRTTPYAKDVIVEVSLRKIDGPDDAQYGLAVRYSDEPRRSYRLFITGEGSYALDSYSGGSSKALVSWRRSPALHTGSASNTIRLAINGSTLFVTFNGVPVARVRDDAIGDPGWVALDAPSGVHLVVRSMTVTESTEQDVAPPATPTAVPAPTTPTATLPATPVNATPAGATPTAGASASPTATATK